MNPESAIPNPAVGVLPPSRTARTESQPRSAVTDSRIWAFPIVPDFGFWISALLLLFHLVVPAVCLAPASAYAAPLLTRWAGSVTSTNVLAEYPRPQLVRAEWQNLNGLWDCAVTGDSRRSPVVFTEKILVPFPIESFLSGVEQRLDEKSTLWYRREFSLPGAWRGRGLQLHFGAVDWAARVFLNGHPIGSHRGGYDSFTFDVSAAANWEGTNELLVAVEDPTEGDQPRGKQSRKPEGIFYTPSSGIWQTVWLEPVSSVRVEGLSLVPDLPARSVRTRVAVNTFAEDVQVEVTTSFGGRETGHARGAPGAEIVVPLSLIRPWSPASPSLYDVEITLRRGAEVLDRMNSYFGLREIRLGADDAGHRRLFLNGQPVFEMGVLDQGFWPDGLYTAPSDEALRFDLETSKRLGFNLVRKHVKVEPERWYYWADRLGLLVWQDMPSGNNTTEAGRRQFEMELQRLVELHANHPSIIMWVLFNEGWGQAQSETERLVRRLKTIDPTRLVDNASGWTDLKVGDVIDLHSYPDPLAPPPEQRRAGVLGEFGGLSLKVENHTWSQQTWGYQAMADPERLTDQYCLLLDKVWTLRRENGLAAAVYTQLTDVETECNGFLTYDRAVLKVDPADVRAANAHLPMLLPDAQQGAYSWSFTTNTPPDEWTLTDFDAAGWGTGVGGFGTRQSPGALVNTVWNTSDIWLRREFTLEANFHPAAKLVMYHDEDAEVYLNGVLAAKTSGFSVRYKQFPISAEALQTLHPGRNVLAVHCHQTTGGQFIDVGLAAESPDQ